MNLIKLKEIAPQEKQKYECELSYSFFIAKIKQEMFGGVQYIFDRITRRKHTHKWEEYIEALGI